MRLATVLFFGILGLGPASDQAPEGGTISQKISREDIEWLDVWLPYTNDTRVAHVLLIGDSITRGYYLEVEKSLRGRVHVDRLSTSKSLGDPALPREIALVLSEQQYQVIHFNNGLHGSGYSEAAYAQALPPVLKVFRQSAPQARIIWASTTDMPPSFEGDHPPTERILERNRLAARWATNNGIPIDDLYTVAARHPEYHAHDACTSRRRGMQHLPSRSLLSSNKRLKQTRGRGDAQLRK